MEKGKGVAMKSRLQSKFFKSVLVNLALVMIAVVGAGCSHKEKVQVDLMVSNEKIPKILAIAPMDTTQLKWENVPVNPQFQESFLPSLKATLERTGVFSEIILLSDHTDASELNDISSIQKAAQNANADFFLKADVVGFDASLPSLIGDMKYLLTTKIRGELFEVYSGRKVWEKTDRIRASRESFYETPDGARETMGVMLDEVVVSSGTAGILQPMVTYLQKKYIDHKGGDFLGRPGDGRDIFTIGKTAKVDQKLAPPKGVVPENPYAYALIMGVEHYPKPIPQVDYATRDAHKIYEYLHTAMGFPTKNIYYLKDNEATLSQMRVRLETWLPSMVGDNPEAEVFVYYGGHGTTDVNSKEAYLVPFDADLTFLAETAYPVDQLYEGLGKLAAKQVTVVLDSCFSGAGGRSTMKKGARPMLVTQFPPVQSTNLVVFTASGAKEISWPYEEMSHGLFTYYFLKGLQGGADSDKDGKVSIQEQYNFLSHHVPTTSMEEHNKLQQPQLLPGLEVLQNRGNRVLIQLK